MSEEDDPVTEKWKIGCGALVFIGLGVSMLIWPDALEGVEATGRRSFLKGIFVWLWGVPGGIVIALLGLLAAASLFRRGGDAS